MPDAAASGVEDGVGQFPIHLLGDLVAHRLLAFDAVRLFERADVEPAFAGTAFGDDLSAIADQSIHQGDMGAVGFALKVVCLRDVARHEDMGFEAGRGCVGGERAGGVSGGRDCDFFYAEFEAH